MDARARARASIIRRRRSGAHSPIRRELREWAPFDADRNIGTTGPMKLSTVGTPTPQISESRVTRAEEPRLLEYSWGGNDMRWELEPLGDGTRLTLWHNIDRKFIAMGAAGWHICFDVLDQSPRRVTPLAASSPATR